MPTATVTRSWLRRVKPSRSRARRVTVRPVLEAFEPVADGRFHVDEGCDGEIGQAAFDVRPHSLDGVEVG